MPPTTGSPPSSSRGCCRTPYRSPTRRQPTSSRRRPAAPAAALLKAQGDRTNRLQGSRGPGRLHKRRRPRRPRTRHRASSAGHRRPATLRQVTGAKTLMVRGSCTKPLPHPSAGDWFIDRPGNCQPAGVSLSSRPRSSCVRRRRPWPHAPRQGCVRGASTAPHNEYRSNSTSPKLTSPFESGIGGARGGHRPPRPPPVCVGRLSASEMRWVAHEGTSALAADGE